MRITNYLYGGQLTTMKITKTELRLIIREEYLRLYEAHINEGTGPGWDANGNCTGSIEECSGSSPSLQGAVVEPEHERGR